MFTLQGGKPRRFSPGRNAPASAAFSPMPAQMFDLCYNLTIVKLTIQLKLLPTSDQAGALKRTLETANTACDYISQVAWDTRTFGKFALSVRKRVTSTSGLTPSSSLR